MKKSYRIALEDIYTTALAGKGIAVEKVTAHRDASATIRAGEDVQAVIQTIPGVEIVASSSVQITFHIPAAHEYHNQNPPLKTEEEKEQERLEKEQRKAERAAKKGQAEARLVNTEDGDDLPDYEEPEDLDI